MIKNVFCKYAVFCPIFGEIFAALVSPQIQSIWNVWHTIWEKAICHERDFGRVYKLASCLQEVFHTTWEKKSFHFTEFTENTQRKTFSMKFPQKIMQSYKRNDSDAKTILGDFSDNYQS